MQRNLAFSLVVVLSVVVVGAILSLVFTQFLSFSATAAPATLLTAAPGAQVAASEGAPGYNSPQVVQDFYLPKD